MMATASDLLVLLRGEFSSLIISFNEEHATNYATAQRYDEEWGGYSREDCRIDWVSEDEKKTAIERNTVWTIQWYPDTPNGFYCVGASTFETAARYALQEYRGK